MSTYDPQYYLNNRNVILARNRSSYETNKEKAAVRRRERYANDPVYRRQRLDNAAKWRREHPDKAREWSRNAKRTEAGLKRIKRYQKRANAVRYGLTIEQRDAIFATNDGLCMICNVTPAEHLDHCHTTGVVRGALCNRCNGGLGFFRDNPELLRAALAYLEVKR